MTDKPHPQKNTAGERMISLGVISGAHGIRGEVKIRSFTADPQSITSYGPLRDHTGRSYIITITGGTNDALIARIQGVSTRNDAETLRNIELLIARNALPQTDAHEYYHEDLAGLTLTSESGERYGTLTGIHNFGAGDLAAIRKTSGEEEYLPFSRKIFTRIDIASGTAVIILPDIETAPDA